MMYDSRCCYVCPLIVHVDCFRADCFLRTEQIKVAFLNVGSGNAEGIPTFVNTVVVNNIDVVCLAEVAEIGRGDNARGARLLCEKLNQHARLHARQVTYTCWYLPSRYALIWRTTGEFQGVQVRAIHDGLGNGRVRYGVFEFIFPKDTLLAPLTVVLVHLRTKRARGWDVNRIRNAAMPKLKKLILKPNTVVLGDFNMSPEDLAARSDVGLNLPWPGAIHDYPITTPKGRKLDFIIYKSRVLRSEVVEQAIADHHMVIAPITIRRVRH